MNVTANADVCCWAGVEGAVVVGNLLESSSGDTFGYNAATDTYEDLVAAGIIDPLKVALLSLVLPISRAEGGWGTEP